MFHIRKELILPLLCQHLHLIPKSNREKEHQSWFHRSQEETSNITDRWPRRKWQTYTRLILNKSSMLHVAKWSMLHVCLSMSKSDCLHVSLFLCLFVCLSANIIPNQPITLLLFIASLWCVRPSNEKNKKLLKSL